MRIFITTLIILAIIIIGAFLIWPADNKKTAVADYDACVAAGYPILESFPEQCRTPDGTVFIKSPDRVEEVSNQPIRVRNVSDNQVIESPFVVRGEARGNWYFEATFPITLLDANGKKLAETYATAQGEWMTESFVPFISEPLTFTSATATGTLVINNANASGLPENSKELRIPVRFEQEMRTVKLYYYNSAKDKDSQGNVLCSAKGLVAVNRQIPLSITPIQDTIRLLLRGEVTASESSQGITSNFPLAGVSLQGASVENKTLTLNFTDPQHSTSGGACRINVMRAQIEATAKQFPEVSSVRITPATLFQP